MITPCKTHIQHREEGDLFVFYFQRDQLTDYVKSSTNLQKSHYQLFRHMLVYEVQEKA